MTKNFTLLTFSIFFTIGGFFAQEKCSAHKLYLEAVQKDPSILIKQANFEKNLSEASKTKGNVPSKGVIYQIPVVIHIIHDGQAIGTGSNITDAVAISMIDVLNEQFRKLTSDSLLPGHPFYNLSVDTEIEFCLAQQDPDGNFTTGINRFQGSQATWEDYEFDSIVKPATIWDRNEYMNLWSCAFTSPTLDGYGTFPDATSDTTDGIVVSFNDFLAPTNNQKSIVATHEVGHYLNLRHIWGDAICGDDLVSDTPPAETDNSGCPNFPHNANSVCGSDANGEMFMNYMDYSDAVCTMVFTPEQTTRMRTTLTTTRSGLLSSIACESVLGLGEILKNTSFTIYPNPSQGNFSLQLNETFSGEYSVQVSDQVGKEIQIFTNISAFPFEFYLENMNDGIYFINLSNGINSVTQKVIVMN